MREHMVTWRDPHGYGFRLELFDTGRYDRHGKFVVDCEFYHRDVLVFSEELYTRNSIDGEQTISDALGFFALQPGDTDPEYFDSYDKCQMDWCITHGELLSLYAEPGSLGTFDEYTGNWNEVTT